MGRKVDQFDDFKSMPPILALVHTVQKKSKRIDHSYVHCYRRLHIHALIFRTLFDIQQLGPQFERTSPISVPIL